MIVPHARTGCARRRRTARPSASSRPRCANGPTPVPIRAPNNASETCRTGRTATISTDPTLAWWQEYLSAHPSKRGQPIETPHLGTATRRITPVTSRQHQDPQCSADVGNSRTGRVLYRRRERSECVPFQHRSEQVRATQIIRTSATYIPLGPADGSAGASSRYPPLRYRSCLLSLRLPGGPSEIHPRYDHRARTRLLFSSRPGAGCEPSGSFHRGYKGSSDLDLRM